MSFVCCVILFAVIHGDEMWCVCGLFFFFQAEDGIRDLVRSRGLGDVYKRQVDDRPGNLFACELDP